MMSYWGIDSDFKSQREKVNAREIPGAMLIALVEC
jgi:hypothetical protein